MRGICDFVVGDAMKTSKAKSHRSLRDFRSEDEMAVILWQHYASVFSDLAVNARLQGELWFVRCYSEDAEWYSGRSRQALFKILGEIEP
jgi:hypothetical protein